MATKALIFYLTAIQFVMFVKSNSHLLNANLL